MVDSNLSLLTTFTNPIASNQLQNPTGNWRALKEIMITGLVAEAVQAETRFANLIRELPTNGHAGISARGVGNVVIRALGGDELIPKPGVIDVSRITLEVRQPTGAWHHFTPFDLAQDATDIVSRTALEHGKAMARHIEETHFIVALKASLKTDSVYKDPGGFTPKGFYGALQESIPTVGDLNDHVKVYDAIQNLLTRLRSYNNVNTNAPGFAIWVSHQTRAILMNDPRVYKTDTWTSVQNSGSEMTIVIDGVPVMTTNYAPFQTNVTTHPFETRSPGDFIGNFTKVWGYIGDPECLWRASTLPLMTTIETPQGFNGNTLLGTNIAYSVGPFQNQMCGALTIA